MDLDRFLLRKGRKPHQREAHHHQSQLHQLFNLPIISSCQRSIRPKAPDRRCCKRSNQDVLAANTCRDHKRVTRHRENLIFSVSRSKHLRLLQIYGSRPYYQDS
jgi:hypothetical protein